MHLGYVSVAGRGQIDLLLAEVVARLENQRVRLVGTVQTNIERTDRNFCDMDLRLMPDGGSVRISVDRGAEARGCRLDPDALEQSVAWISRNLDGAEMLVVNKFGKMESEGRGLCGVIATALDRNMPVLVGVNAYNLPAFDAFAGGMAQALDPCAEMVAAWCARACIGSRSACPA